MGTIAALHPLYHLGALISLVALALRGQFPLRLMLLLSFVFYAADDFFGYADHAWSYQLWNGLFFCINLYVLVEITLDRTTFGLNAEEKEVLSDLFSLSPGEFRKLMRIAAWREANESRLITVEGVAPTSLFYVHRGAIEIMKSGRTLVVEPPTFIGEIVFLRGGTASATVAIAPGSRYIEWSASALHRHLSRHEALRVALNRAISDDLAMKVARS